MARRPPKNSQRAVGLAAPAFFQMSDACHRTCARCRIEAADASLSLCMVCMIRREVGPKMKIVCGFWDSERNFGGCGWDEGGNSRSGALGWRPVKTLFAAGAK